MKHYDEERLILHHYGESDDPEATERHLASCESCRAAYAGLRRTFDALDTVDAPDRPEGYEREVWARLQARIGVEATDSRWGWFAPLWLLPVAATVVVAALAFLAGERHGERVALQDQDGSTMPGSARERVLLIAVGDHLDRSQRLLVELAHTEGNGGADVTEHRDRARALVAGNRLYRRGVAEDGDAGAADLLDELERVLLELSNGPANLTQEELLDLQSRIEKRGLLLKIRVLGGRTNDELRPAPATRTANEV